MKLLTVFAILGILFLYGCVSSAEKAVEKPLETKEYFLPAEGKTLDFVVFRTDYEGGFQIRGTNWSESGEIEYEILQKMDYEDWPLNQEKISYTSRQGSGLPYYVKRAWDTAGDFRLNYTEKVSSCSGEYDCAMGFREQREYAYSNSDNVSDLMYTCLENTSFVVQWKNYDAKTGFVYDSFGLKGYPCLNLDMNSFEDCGYSAGRACFADILDKKQGLKPQAIDISISPVGYSYNLKDEELTIKKRDVMGEGMGIDISDGNPKIIIKLMKLDVGGKTAEFTILDSREVGIGKSFSLSSGEFVQIYDKNGGVYVSVEEISSQPAPHASVLVYRK